MNSNFNREQGDIDTYRSARVVFNSFSTHNSVDINMWPTVYQKSKNVKKTKLCKGLKRLIVNSTSG